ncbi:PWWP domain [Musa troglodytarum]|uniref:PWWP domain n=1 Tax=Musa troglodytarum TaxID=320322 RepID=A0A9E7HWC8_9LILI|nr:PWWP domain [Musa troglodytarum]URE36754.1 PWWP domain [Musa troglodytarum]
MESSPLANKAGGGSLDLNSIASEQPETLASPVDLGSGAFEVGARDDASAVGRGNVVGEQAEEVGVEQDGVEKKDGMAGEDVVQAAGGERGNGYSGAVDVGDVKDVVEGTDGEVTEDRGEGAEAEAGEANVAVEVKPWYEDADVVDEKATIEGDTASQEMASNVATEAGGGEDQDVKVGEQESTARRKRGRPRKLVNKGDSVGQDVGSKAGTDTLSGEEQVSSAKRMRGRPRRAVTACIDDAYCHYHFQDEKKDPFAASNLVWGKVRSHPWWPGQIFDPLDASEMASNIQKKDHHLVAYFGDRTFAWCDDSRLKPFQTHFSQMEKQSSMDAFASAISDALQEVSRRIELGMTCDCFMDETYARVNDQMVENAGIRKETCISAVDKSWIVSSLDTVRLLDRIQTLAQFPYGAVDRLELAITKSQLKAFYRSKGYPELPVFVYGEGLGDNVEGSPTKRTYGKDVADPSTPTLSDTASRKGKSRVGGSSFRKDKHIVEHGRKKKSLSELMEKSSEHHDADGEKSGSGGNASSLSSHKELEVADSDGAESGKSKKKKLDSLGDLITMSQISRSKKQPKVGECMRRVAGQMSGPPPMLKLSGKSVTKTSTILSHRKGGIPKDYSSPGEMLSQLCLVARDPLGGYDTLSSMVSLFTDFRNGTIPSRSMDEKHKGAVAGKRDRRKSASFLAAFSEKLDYMQDSYWSDIIVSDEENLVSSGQKRERESQRKRQKEQQPEDESALLLTLSSLPDTKQHLRDDSTNTNNAKEMQGARTTGKSSLDCSSNPNSMQEVECVGPTSNLQNDVDECMPTALVLTFSEASSIPAEADLIKLFGRYGPLMEAETEVTKSKNHAKIVFKRRSDAEVALSNAGKYSIFGHTLVSYRLRILEAEPKASLSSTALGEQDALPVA